MDVKCSGNHSCNLKPSSIIWYLSFFKIIEIFRFNIYQEVVLAAVYKIYDFRLKPILFYTYSVFCLQGVYLSSLYLISWTLSGSWLTGVLTSILVCVNRLLSYLYVFKFSHLKHPIQQKSYHEYYLFKDRVSRKHIR